MALVNYTVVNAAPEVPALVSTTPGALRIGLDDLLYSPDDHQIDSPAILRTNEPFAPPTNTQQKRSKLRKRAGASYLPPPNQFTQYPRHDDVPHNPYMTQLHTQMYQQNSRLNVQIDNQRVQEINPQYDNTGQYVHDPTGDYDYEQRRLNQNTRPAPDYRQRPGFLDPPFPPATPAPEESISSRRFDANSNQPIPNNNFFPNVAASTPGPRPPSENVSKNSNNNGRSPTQSPADRPPGFTKVETGGSGGKTQLHAVLDYDEDYYDDIPGPGNINLI